MKYFTLNILFINLLLSFNIDNEIAKIQMADKEQRYILMNNLKRKLFQENSIRRQEILEQMHTELVQQQHQLHINIEDIKRSQTNKPFKKQKYKQNAGDRWQRQ